MADRQDGRPALGQPVFKGRDGHYVQVVGRLVEQQDVGVFGKGPGQGCSARFPARQTGRPPRGVEAEGFQRRFRFMPRGPAACGIVGQGVAGDVGLLRNQRDARAGLNKFLACVRLHGARQDAQQGRLSGPVAAHQTGAGARLQRQVDAFKKLDGPVGEANVFQGKDRGGAAHDAPL